MQGILQALLLLGRQCRQRVSTDITWGREQTIFFKENKTSRLKHINCTLAVCRLHHICFCWVWPLSDKTLLPPHIPTPWQPSVLHELFPFTFVFLSLYISLFSWHLQLTTLQETGGEKKRERERATDRKKDREKQSEKECREYCKPCWSWKGSEGKECQLTCHGKGSTQL